MPMEKKACIVKQQYLEKKLLRPANLGHGSL